MIRYTLKCDNDHSFESWVKSGEAFDQLKARDLLSCAVCGSVKVDRALMTPQVRPARSKATPPLHAKAGPLSAPLSAAEQAIGELKKKVEAGTEDVGENFALEARAMHDGDAPERGIRGKAKPEEARALLEDGIAISPLPWLDRKSN